MSLVSGQLSVPQPSKIGFTKQNGVWTEYSVEYAGATAQNDAVLFADQYRYACDSWNVEPIGGGAYRVTIKFAYNATGAGGNGVGGGVGGGAGDSNEPLNNVWELQPNVVQKDFLESDISIVNNFTAAQIVEIRTAGSNLAIDISGYTANQQTAIKLLRAGVTSVTVFAPVLKHTLLVRQDYSVATSILYSGFVIKNITTIENVPTALIFTLPPSTTVTRTDGLTMQYGWLKKFPTVTQVAGGKWQINQEWEYGLWSNDLYTFI